MLAFPLPWADSRTRPKKLVTAVAETAYWRLYFFSRSPGFRPPTTVVEHSAFTVPIRTARLLDLSETPYAARAEAWTDPDDYSACQSFARTARAITAQAIRYVSVRDPDRRANIALLDPSAFAAPAPDIRQTWHFRYEGGRMTAYAAFPSDERHVFTAETFGL